MAEADGDVDLVVKLSSFDNRLDKISLALMSSVEAKNESVKSFGIGEDLAMNIFCWKGNRLRLMIQLRSDVQQAKPMERFQAITDAVCVTRRGWGIDGYTLMSEGYMSPDPDRTQGIELKRAFLDPTYQVRECITITHVEDGYVTFVVKPYTYGVPRTVLWEDEIYHPGRSIVRGQDGLYPNMLHRAMATIEPEDEVFDEDTFYDTLSRGLVDSGFLCQVFE